LEIISYKSGNNSLSFSNLFSPRGASLTGLSLSPSPPPSSPPPIICDSEPLIEGVRVNEGQASEELCSLASTETAPSPEALLVLNPRNLEGKCTGQTDGQGFSARSMNYFLTVNCLPKEVDPSVLLDFYLKGATTSNRGSIAPSFVVAAVEAYKDGGFHGHLYLRYGRARLVKNSHSFCFTYKKERYHCSIRKVPPVDVPRVVRYVIKDGRYVSNNQQELDSYTYDRKKKRKPLNELTAALMEGSTVEGLLTVDNSHLVMQNLARLHDFHNWYKAVKITKSSKYEWPGLTTMPANTLESVDFASEAICYWIRVEVLGFQNKRVRPIKTPNLWIVSPSGKGKSTLVQFLSHFFRVMFMFPSQGKYFFPRDINEYQFIVLDEYNAQFTFSDFKRITDGSPVMVDVKNGQQFLKDKNIPIIILTNHAPSEIYHNIFDRDEDAANQLESRFRVIYLNQMIKLFLENDLIGKSGQILAQEGVPLFEANLLLLSDKTE